MKKVLSFVLAFVLSLQPCAATLVSKPFTFTPGQTIYSAQVNSNFDTLYSVINGNLDNTNIGAAGIYASQIIPTTSGQATFGGSQVYTFSNGISVPTGKSIVGDVPNKVFNVKTYGATGNGTTDDTTAIQAALTAAAVAGGTVYFPQGQYKISSPLTITGSTGGVIVRGAGVPLEGGSAFGSVIEPTYASGDVFTATATGGTVQFFDFGVNRLAQGVTTPTGGVTFDLTGVIGGSAINNVRTWGDYDVISTGVHGSGLPGQLYVTNSDFYDGFHHGINIAGNSGGVHLAHLLFSGNSTQYTGGATTWFTYVSPFAGSDTLDPLYINDVDVESYAAGYVQNVSSGHVVDVFIDGLLVDTVNTLGAFYVITNGSSSFNRAKIIKSWFESNAANVDAVALSSQQNGTYFAGIDEVTLSDDNISGTGSGSDGLLIGDGARDVVASNLTLYASAGCGVRIGSTFTTKNITITGGRSGDVYGDTQTYGACISPAASATVDKVTISGVDLTGNATSALFISNGVSGNVSSNLTITGNTMTGYTTPVTFSGQESGSMKFSANNGYQFETSTSGAGVDGWTFNRLNANSSDNIASFQFQGSQKLGIKGDGTVTAAGPFSATTGTFTGLLTGTTAAFSGAVTSTTIAKIFQESSQLTSNPHVESHTGTTIAGTVTYTFASSYSAAPICVATVGGGQAAHTLALGTVSSSAAQISDGAIDTYYLICVGQ